MLAKFGIGQIIDHKRFAYRGVVFDVDPIFQLTDEWYEEVAKSRPPKDEPWYHVMVHGSDQVTYVAEQNLEPASDEAPIHHPMLGEYFADFREGTYVTNRVPS